MKTRVTCGAGFIGSAVIRHITGNTRSSVVNLDTLTYAGIHKAVEWYLSNSDWVAHIKSAAYQQWIEQNYVERGTQ